LAENKKLKAEAEEFFSEWKRAKREYLRLSRLREEKLSLVGYISYAVLFGGVMTLVALKINSVKSTALYITFLSLTAAALLYLVIGQVVIGFYEKKGRRKREVEFKEAEAKYKKLLLKKDYYFGLKECAFDEEAYKAKAEAEKKAKKEALRAAKAAKTLVKNEKFNDSVCVYCKNGICGFEADETVYSFRCEYETCRWRSDKKI
jgi:hypothetical protein